MRPARLFQLVLLVRLVPLVRLVLLVRLVPLVRLVLLVLLVLLAAGSSLGPDPGVGRPRTGSRRPPHRMTPASSDRSMRTRHVGAWLRMDVRTTHLRSTP
ncbi:hypothetical protein [Streptomyces sp. NPDC091259]|uniref:hypothetical protein n=1 Tax=Streptomyces sp. NPDC091259 TaxID=3365976 RepID=UPI003827980C